MASEMILIIQIVHTGKSMYRDEYPGSDVDVMFKLVHGASAQMLLPEAEQLFLMHARPSTPVKGTMCGGIWIANKGYC